MKGSLYFLGRFGQLLAMSLLLMDIVTAGPLGPDPKLFSVGVGVFIAGWGLTKVSKK